jgi:hypothetical protein
MVASIGLKRALCDQSKDDASAVHLISARRDQRPMRARDCSSLLLFPFFLLLRRGGVWNLKDFESVSLVELCSQ